MLVAMSDATSRDEQPDSDLPVIEVAVTPGTPAVKVIFQRDGTVKVNGKVVTLSEMIPEVQRITGGPKAEDT